MVLHSIQFAATTWHVKFKVSHITWTLNYFKVKGQYFSYGGGFSTEGSQMATVPLNWMQESNHTNAQSDDLATEQK